MIGERWLRYLDSRWQRDEFSRGPGRLLLAAPYARPATIERQHAIDLARPLCGVAQGAERAPEPRAREGARRRSAARRGGGIDVGAHGGTELSRCGRSPGAGCCSRCRCRGSSASSCPATRSIATPRSRCRSAAEFADLAGLRGPALRKEWRLAALVEVWLLAVLAAARPQFVGEPIALPMTGRDLLLSVDLSGSMEEQDFQLQRPVGRPAHRDQIRREATSSSAASAIVSA